MTNGELLRRIFRGFAKRDDALFRAAAEEIVRDERAKNHRLLADDLERILLNGNDRPNLCPGLGASYAIPKDRERDAQLLEITEPRYDWDRILLSRHALETLERVAREHRKRDLLAAAGIKPTQRLLFYGPPGCGKTLAAQVLASVLEFPLVTVRFDAVVSSYLGETAANLRKVFDFISRGQWVVLFDDFDAIGKDRDNPFEHGELKRVVNTLLQLMDAFHAESLLIAATNHENLLDSAVWRRFESIVRFAPPTPQERILLMRLFLRGFDTSSVDVTSTGRRLSNATGSDIESVCIESVRRALLSGRNRVTPDDMRPAIHALRERIAALRGIAGEPAAQKQGHPPAEAAGHVRGTDAEGSTTL